MFDLPEAKRIRRADLYNHTRSSSTSPPPLSPADPDLEAQLRKRLELIYGPVPIPISDPAQKHTEDNQAEIEAQDEPHEQEQGQEQEFEFRLFSTPIPTAKDSIGNSGTQVHKIVLREPEEEQGEGHFVVRERDRRFYIASKAQGPELERYEHSAITGEEVLKAAKERAWGLEVPWRVTVLRLPTPTPAPARRKEGRRGEEWVQTEGDTKKTKPNKKRRILLREHKKKRECAEEAKRKEREAKEEAEREKKTRRNREKKVKRKMKEKAKKIDGEGVVENGDGNGNGNGDENGDGGVND